jgi:hypothetical protein
LADPEVHALLGPGEAGGLNFRAGPSGAGSRGKPHIIDRMESSPETPATFSLDQARELLPAVKHLTADAVRASELLASQLQGLLEDDPDFQGLTLALKEVAERWVEEVGALGLEAKGLWLVDFDNGQGYYCWSYPEPTISHYHGYEEGFAGRMRIQ